jgi:methylamine dehydrogenase light chain
VNDLDRIMEVSARFLAGRASRRGALARLGRLILASSVMLPALPVARARASDTANDDQQCDYWKYCAIDGFLCTCCGGSVNQCPPGTEPGKVAWVGTCRSHTDGRDYLISYTDCCGKASCGRCGCNANVGDRPGYEMGVHNDINWCMGNTESTIYNCTVALVLGEG